MNANTESIFLLKSNPLLNMDHFFTSGIKRNFGNQVLLPGLKCWAIPMPIAQIDLLTPLSVIEPSLLNTHKVSSLAWDQKGTNSNFDSKPTI